MAEPVSTKDQIRDFIVENFGPSRNVTSVTDDEPLLERGILDSLTIFRLVAFLEETFGVRIGDEEITPSNLHSVNAIAKLVEQKTTRAANR
jgi:acyl carrier protein